MRPWWRVCICVVRFTVLGASRGDAQCVDCVAGSCNPGFNSEMCCWMPPTFTCLQCGHWCAGNQDFRVTKPGRHRLGATEIWIFEKSGGTRSLAGLQGG